MCSYSCLKSGLEILFQVRINRSLTASGRVCPSHPRHRYWACWRPLHRQLSLLHSDEVQLDSDRVERSHGEIPATLSSNHIAVFSSWPITFERAKLYENKMEKELEKELLPPAEFPFPFKPYDIQKDFMRSLYTALERGCIGIFESPTGTVGKTM